MHSQFSCDAKNTMEEMCRAAIEVGLAEITVTDHFDPHPLDECPGFYRPDAYFDELARCQAQFAGQLRIKAGVEVGDAHRFPAEVAAVVRTHQYDFVIGSVHWIGDETPFGRAFFVSHDAGWAYGGYFAEMARMVKADDFDVVGHLDLIKREGTEYYGRFAPEPYADVLRDVLGTLVQRGKGIEINTSGWRRSAGEPCPGLTVLRWYAELGGEVLTIGSDSHRTPHVGLFYDEAVALAKEAGLRWLSTFEGRKPTQHPLDP